jgi:tetratricopeptide (TPR) repeat protein
MKNILYILLLTTQVSLPGFEKGNALYKTGKYEQAIDAYGSVLKTNQHSSELYLTLGTVIIN